MMRTLYVSQQGCYVSVRQESLRVKRGGAVLEEVPLPLLEQVLIFGQAQVTTPAIRACLWREIPIGYLSRLGWCYGRVLPIGRGYRQLGRYQQELAFGERMGVARAIVQAKLKNSRVMLQRQQRQRGTERILAAIGQLELLMAQVRRTDSLEALMGLEGSGAAVYFGALGDCLVGAGFAFGARSRRPPADPVNALLSFGYQVLWNHLLSLIELQGLDPYCACLHQGSERHAALASDLIEEFRAPIVDSLVLYLVNRGVVRIEEDFEYRNQGCFLNESGRKKYLRAFVQRMEEPLQTEDGTQPRWDLLTQQVKAFKRFVYAPSSGYQPYLIR
ncbi:MAG: CRISPR-associated endonuclease Cas1 [Leptolyngbya sp. IPPAS B-1204]